MAGDSKDQTSPVCATDSSESSGDASLDAAIHEAVWLHPHDPDWPRAFERERDRLHAIAPGAFVAIEHIGSTAVPRLVAKPVIDILAAVDSLVGVDGLIDRLCNNGYTTSAEFNATLVDRKWLMRWHGGRRTHHLHIVVADSTAWHDRIQFRDALRTQPDLARRYTELKTTLAVEHRDDREAYTDAKLAFVLATLESIRRR